MILNSVFKETVVANIDEQFVNCEFISGTTAKQKDVFGLTVADNANVTIESCKFSNKGYSAIFMNSTGKIDIKNNQFDCTGLYNPIEGGSSANNALLDEINISGNVLQGICGNNYINFYNVKDGAVINISDNKISGMSQQAEVIRLSNLANNSATFNVTNMDYSYDMSTAYDENWTKMFLCQDYTKDGIQDFRKFTINVKGTKCNGVEVKNADSFPVGGLVCIYDANKSFDGESIYPAGNMPTFTIE